VRRTVRSASERKWDALGRLLNAAKRLRTANLRSGADREAYRRAL
jgi:hypothetical protein